MLIKHFTEKLIFLVAVQSLSHTQLFAAPQTASHLAPLPCPPLSPVACSNSSPLSQWSHLTTSFSATHFSSCPQSFPASGSFPMNQLFASRSQSVRVSASASVLPMNIQAWFPLGLTGLILQSNGLSRVFSNTTVQEHRFFDTQSSYGPTPTSVRDYWKNHSFDYKNLCQQSDIFAF